MIGLLRTDESTVQLRSTSPNPSELEGPLQWEDMQFTSRSAAVSTSSAASDAAKWP